jgi:hypothetical protein
LLSPEVPNGVHEAAYDLVVSSREYKAFMSNRKHKYSEGESNWWYDVLYYSPKSKAIYGSLIYQVEMLEDDKRTGSYVAAYYSFKMTDIHWFKQIKSTSAALNKTITFSSENNHHEQTSKLKAGALVDDIDLRNVSWEFKSLCTGPGWRGR